MEHHEEETCAVSVRVSWDEMDPARQAALIAMADSWITGGRLWRAFFYMVTGVGALAATVYYILQAIGFIAAHSEKISTH